MPAPSQLAIATAALQRLVNEESSYHKELEKQEARLLKTTANEDGDENNEYQLRQEKAAIEETKAVFPPLRQRIADALARLEDQLTSGKANGSASDEEIANATEVISKAQEVSKKA